MPGHQRILYFSTQFPNQRSPSMGVFSLQRVRALRAAGCEVVVISPVLLTPPPGMITRPGSAYRWIRSQVRQPFEMLMQGIPAYYPKYWCPPRQIFGWYTSFFLFLQVRRAVLKLAIEFRPDAILSSWLPDSVAVVKLGDLLNIPTLAIADGTDVNAWPEAYRGWKYARNILNEKAAAILFVSNALRKVGLAMGLHGRKNIVLRNAVDTHLFQPSSSGETNGVFTVLSVGRLVRLKGSHILLDAFAEFQRCLGGPARLILVGEGPEREALSRQAVNLGIRSSVVIMGPVEQRELVKIYQAADVFCLPSFSEGFPCAVVEAMACGKPVVASRVGGVPEVVDSGSGILVEPGNPVLLSQALLRAKNQNWDRERIRQKIVAGFGWEKWAGTMIGLVDGAST